MSDFRYKAFVSYSWSDAAWGKWLLQSIETYRTPAALVGKAGTHGPVAARLHPLFKDREEEAAGASIGQAVETALAASEFLIVICSPRSARSQWVDREIAWFKTHRDPTKILALIIDGNPGGGEAECFPRALTHRVAADRTITDEPVDAPLAADARISGDGKRRAKLKLAAAMLGVGLDELVNRDERRRTVRTRLVVGASLALALVMSGMAWAQVQARREADHQRAESDGLVEFMLTDLRKRLEPVGRLDALDVVGQRALTYYAGQKASSLDADALGRRARALHLVGEVSNVRGDSAAGLIAFRQAAATTGEQLDRDPNNPHRIFDHEQSVYWVGYTAYERGEVKEAEAQFREYKRLADKLVALDPNNADWQLEVSYAESNLGTLLLNQGRYPEAEESFANAQRIVEAIADHDPADLTKQINMAQAVSWTAFSLERQEKIDASIALYQREKEIYDLVLTTDGGNMTAKSGIGTALIGIGRLEAMRGNAAKALAAMQQAVDSSGALRSAEPGNTLWIQYEVKRRYELGNVALLFGKPDLARAQLATARDLLAGLMAKDRTNGIWNIDLAAQFDELEARLLVASGRYEAAKARADHAIALLGQRKDGNDPAIRGVYASALLVRGDLHLRQGERAAADQDWQGVDRLIQGANDALPSALLMLRYAAARRQGGAASAQPIRQVLDRRGWRHPAYLRELRLRG